MRDPLERSVPPCDGRPVAQPVPRVKNDLLALEDPTGRAGRFARVLCSGKLIYPIPKGRASDEFAFRGGEVDAAKCMHLYFSSPVHLREGARMEDHS